VLAGPTFAVAGLQVAPPPAGREADESWAWPSAEPERQDGLWKELLWQHCHFLHRAVKGIPSDAWSIKAPSRFLSE